MVVENIYTLIELLQNCFSTKGLRNFFDRRDFSDRSRVVKITIVTIYQNILCLL